MDEREPERLLGQFVYKANYSVEDIAYMASEMNHDEMQAFLLVLFGRLKRPDYARQALATLECLVADMGDEDGER